MLVKLLLPLLFAVSASAQVQIIKPDIIESHYAPKNLVKNPEFEKNGLYVTTSDMGAGKTCTSGAVINGACSLSLSAQDAGDYIGIQLNPTPQSLAGQACEASFKYMNTTGSAAVAVGVKAYVYNTTTSKVVSSEMTLESVAGVGTLRRITPLIYPCGALGDTHEIRIEATDSGLGFVVDSVHGGEAFSISTAAIGSEWASYTPGTNGLGTVTVPSNGCQWKREGEDLLAQCKLTVGTVTGSEMRVDLPSGYTTAGTNKIASIKVVGSMIRSATGATAMYVLAEPSKTYFTFCVQSGAANCSAAQVATAILSNSETISFYARVPIAGATSGYAVAANQTDFGWTGYTITPSTGAFGTTTTNVAEYMRKGQNLHVRWQLVQTAAGTTGSGTYTFNLPPGLTARIPGAVSTTELLGYQIGFGSINCGGAETYASVPVTLYDSTHFMMGYRNNNDSPWASSTCAIGGNNSIKVTAEFYVPIVGWIDTGSAPQLINSVISPTTNGVTNIFSGNYGGASIISECAAGTTCTLYGSTGNVTVVHSATTGNFNINVASGICSAPLACTINHVNIGNQATILNPLIHSTVATAATATTYPFSTVNGSLAGVTSFGSFVCTCQR